MVVGQIKLVENSVNLIYIHIFVVTINNIMQSKEIIMAPIADAIIPSGVVDSPSACGALYI
jgi:hypothetical protein